MKLDRSAHARVQVDGRVVTGRVRRERDCFVEFVLEAEASSPIVPRMFEDVRDRTALDDPRLRMRRNEKNEEREGDA